MHLLESAREGYDAHTTGNEHGMKHHSDPLYVEALRQQYLSPSPEPWDMEEIRTIMQRSPALGEFVSVVYTGDDQNRIVAGALMRRDEPTQNGRELTAHVTDIVVDEPHRRQKLASYMIGVIWQRVPWYGNGPIYPTRLVVNSEPHEVPAWFGEGLNQAGFRPEDEHEYTLHLPGVWYARFIEPDEYDDLLSRMPPEWSGVISHLAPPVDENEEKDLVGVITAFREGKTVGTVMHAPNHSEVTYDDFGNVLIERQLRNSNGDIIHSSSYGSDQFAVVDLLNHTAIRGIDS